MEMSNCRKCKKLFPKLYDPICDNCKKEEEALFDKVRNFLGDNKNATILEISENTGASAKKILSYLREGRLEISSASGELICRMCSAPISSGQYCEKCLIEVNQQIASFAPGSKNKPQSAGDDAKGAAMRVRRE